MITVKWVMNANIMPMQAIFIILTFCLHANLVISYNNNDDIQQRILRFIEKAAAKVHNANGLAYHEHVDPEVNMNVTELVTSKGYPCEEYTVQTADGFLLGIQRIPHGLKLSPGKRSAIFLQHGLLCSATNWIVNLANESLAFILADAGFDVWLGNNRGNSYSRQHITLKPHQDEFWAWSWDQMARYDFPAQVDFALKKSGQSELYYVGHSQGTTQAFAHLSENPAMSSKIKAFFALAPVVTLSSTQTPFRYFSNVPDEVIRLFLGKKDFLPQSGILDLLADTVCLHHDTRYLCRDVVFLLAGYDIKNMNSSRLPIYISHTPSGSSVQDIVHFLQQIRTGLFQKYNYGSSAENKKHYNQTTPPMYDVNKMVTPVYMFSGENDWLADPKDVAHLKASLTKGQVKGSFVIPAWNHLDFIWGMDAARLVYSHIISIIKQQS